MKDFRITMESFGKDLPENWKEIAELLNLIIAADLCEQERFSDYDIGSLNYELERYRVVERIWETFWREHPDGKL